VKCRSKVLTIRPLAIVVVQYLRQQAKAISLFSASAKARMNGAAIHHNPYHSPVSEAPERTERFPS